ncbi:hypothetical protein ACMSZQ_004505, partial [Cronobacter dublinensis]
IKIGTLKGPPIFSWTVQQLRGDVAKNKFTICKYYWMNRNGFTIITNRNRALSPSGHPPLSGKEYFMSTQNSLNTRNMLARNIYVGLQILLDGKFFTVTQVEKGEYCGQEVIEIDFEWPENCDVLHAGFYTPGEVVKVHSSSNQVLCI